VTAVLTPAAVPAGAPTTGHDWRVVAPWYRWALADGSEPERAEEAARPALHKYVSTSFVEEFLADPQRSVAFDPAVDSHFPLEQIPASERLRDGRVRILAGMRRLDPDMRKLFLAAHQRFYVVAVGLHCAVPGYPMVDPSVVAEAGFVLRRHRAVVPADAVKEGFTLVQSVAVARAKAQVQYGYDNAKARSRLLHPFGSAHRDRVVSASAASVGAAREVALARRRLRSWAETAGVDLVTEGWVPTGDGSFGAWVPMPEEPEELIERTYPLRNLRAAPDDPGHAALDGTIFWGPVPTGSDEITADGTARFSRTDVYELRAFVRPDHGDCPGPLRWSEPTLPFRLASFYDPDGCAQRPTDVQLPDFADLQAANALPSVKMTAPPGSSLKLGADGKPVVGSDFEICFFSIPLITIIAMFVLNIFLPIVLLVFQLFWMLKLKFCIPPSIEFEADLAFELDVEPPQLELMADVDIDLLPGVDRGALASVLGKIFSPPVDPDFAAQKQDDPSADPSGPPWPLGPEFADQLELDPLFKLSLAQGYGSADGGAPDFAPPVIHTTPVRRDQVVHP
jgi:hypothetical protein